MIVEQHIYFTTKCIFELKVKLLKVQNFKNMIVKQHNCLPQKLIFKRNYFQINAGVSYEIGTHHISSYLNTLTRFLPMAKI